MSGSLNEQLLQFLAPPDVSATHLTFRKEHTPDTGNWFVNSEEFQNWLTGPEKFMWLFGLREYFCTFDHVTEY